MADPGMFIIVYFLFLSFIESTKYNKSWGSVCNLERCRNSCDIYYIRSIIRRKSKFDRYNLTYYDNQWMYFA